jgi:hypothetical protein
MFTKVRSDTRVRDTASKRASVGGKWESAGMALHRRKRMSAEILHCNVCVRWKTDVKGVSLAQIAVP